MLLCADPFLNDVNFVLSVLTLEELGATGNKVSPNQRLHSSQSHLPAGHCCTAEIACMNNGHSMTLTMKINPDSSYHLAGPDWPHNQPCSGQRYCRPCHICHSPGCY